jgi:3-keto-5-aminohexanoate cleavage enzyme
MTEIKDYLFDYANVRGIKERMLRGMANLPPLIISVAITGANHGKEANPNLPETPEEQTEQTYDAYMAGASMVHIHRRRRDNPGEPSLDTEDYLEINAMIREKCPDIIINNTAAGGRMRFGDSDKVGDLMVSSIYAKPEVASFDTSNYVTRAIRKARKPPLTGRPEDSPIEFSFSMTPSEAERVVMIMKENGAKPEFEIFDTGDLHYLYELSANGFVEKPYWVQLVMHPGANFPIPSYLLTMLQQTPPGSLVSVIGVGPSQIPILTIAMILGCHVRVGMEDNVYIEKGKLADSNAQFVEKVVRLAKELGRDIATPQQARAMIGISQTPRQYK